MRAVNVNADYLNVDREALAPYLKRAELAQEKLYAGSGVGNDFIGWVNYAAELSDELIADIKQTAQQIRETADVLLVIGIGGSYLGAQSALKALLPPFDNEVKIKASSGLRIYFLGHQMSDRYINALLEHIADDEVCVNVISKSGTTTEPAVAFRIVRQFMQNKYGDDYCKRIVATTDKARGALKTFADSKGIKSYQIPDDVGGRYSVFTPVGLLPIAAAGIDIRALVGGAQTAYRELKNADSDNAARHYAALRHYLYEKGHNVEVLVNYNPELSDLAEWWKQLFGESEGKDGKGILPHAMNFTTDLHSLGQYVQDGERVLFETVIDVVDDDAGLMLPRDEEDLDGLNYLTDKSIAQINRTAMLATILAHREGGAPNIVLQLAKLDAYHLGYLYYFFMLACGISGYMLAVNPFNQPGVEDYKKNMFALLGKPGYEELAEKLGK
ncbi:MAG: glucose-6-phosphate isomerase [Clostridiales bacterium]|nr:MAG: glucose-6-phosphate isomerase [Clostridiales bacterium]